MTKYKVWDKEEGMYGLFDSIDAAKGFIEGLLEADNFYKKYYTASDFEIIEEED